MEQDDELRKSESEQEWKPKLLALRRQFSELCVFVEEVRRSNGLSADQATQVYRSFTETAVHRSGSSGMEFDAVSHGLMRDGIHQMRTRLISFCPALQSEILRRFPNGPSR